MQAYATELLDRMIEGGAAEWSLLLVAPFVGSFLGLLIRRLPNGSPIARGRSRCEACGATSSLRLCTECGHVGCCESQQSHGRRHALGEGHPVIKSLPLAKSSFTWCYTCDRYV